MQIFGYPSSSKALEKKVTYQLDTIALEGAIKILQLSLSEICNKCTYFA